MSGIGGKVHYHAQNMTLGHLESFRLDKGYNLGNLFEPLMTAITTTATHLTDMKLGDLDTILYLVQPTCVHIFHSIRVLEIWLPKIMEGPVEILPHLQRLEVFKAKHLFLPIYPPGVHLPLIQTLYSLFLKSVSVQWMAGQVFPALQCCFIRSPHHINTIALQPVSMPHCTLFDYDSNDLGPSRYFDLAPLHCLNVTSGQWSVWRGNFQFMSFLKPIVMANAQSLTELHVHVQCSESLLTGMLKLVTALKRLGLGLISPHALSEKFYQQFVATESSASSSCEVIWLPRLTDLDLSYKRCLRELERKTLIPVFSDIVESHQERSFSLFLNCHEGEEWVVQG
jgi:hypothetical protein